MHFIPVKASAELWISAATPEITSVVWKTIPLARPALNATPHLAPLERLLANRYILSGPGAKVKRIEAVKKYNKSVRHKQKI